MKLLDNSRLWRWLLAAYFIALALIGFWPSPVDEPVQGALADVLSWLHAHGIPRWLNYRFVEASANTLLFVPVGFSAVLAFRANKWWQNAFPGILASGCIELGQLLFLNRRVASALDFVTNTAGTFMGILLAWTILQVLERRQAQRISER